MDIPYIDHVKFEHNMWHYLWFWIHLESKDPLSYTGPEQYAFLNYANKNVRAQNIVVVFAICIR
jgi:hypothetical protein